MSEKLPVVAAVPNYNMADSLKELLPQLLAQGYDAVYVLDDVSTDHSKQVVEQFPAVKWIGGDVNLGAGGNRNRVLEAHPEECIIHFVDADVRLKTANIPPKARVLMATPDVGFVGGLVIENGRQSIWNFGQYPSFQSNVAGTLQTLFGTVQNTKPLWRRAIRRIMKYYLATMPDPVTEPRRQTVFWTHEANLLIKRSTLVNLGGFDAAIREHDIMGPAFMAKQAGLTSYFDPTIAVEHTQLDVRNYNRKLSRLKIARYLRHKYGMSIWT